MQSTTLKKPFGVYALALLFILAPLGNILISFAGSGVENWYSPSIFFVFLESIPLADWAWLILTFVTGCLLFVQHKTAWSLAVLSLLVVLGINAYRAFNPGDVASVEFLKWQIVISMLVTLAVLVLAFYFRFPYLDRRAQWFFPTAHRWDLRTPVEVVGEDIIGQIQCAKVQDFLKFEKDLLSQKNYLIEISNREVAFGLVRRGGGVTDLVVRRVPRGDGSDMAVIHIHMNPCDAMGANIINQVCEFLKEPIEQFTGEKVTMCILSNLVDTKVTRAVVQIDDLDPELAEKIEEASLFAQQDPYRAATNNKGVLNGIDPIVIATGNDWRAVEAGIHAYAARDGQYRSITRWKRDGKKLVGLFEAPLVVGTVGGVTTLHPMAKMSMNMLGVQSANELSRVMAAVGLVQNLGALKALTTVGIIEGHMKLHIKNLTLGAGAEEKEIPIVQKKLEEILAIRKRISLSNAIEVLRELRSSQGTQQP